ncbi:uncharacterized protein LOC141917278 isoform X1 [Strix aluco]|uniref:uncharacterized protein LOC141917278 isoform X1 n=1 Tax=Strix aluco TaxID=111821 RepID=UPI003DA5996E
MAATTIYARCDFATPKPDSPPRSAPSTCRKLPRPWWYWMLLGSGWVGTVLLVGVVLRLLQQHGGNNPIPSQDAEVLGSGCSWESCWTNSSQRATPEFKCSLSCFRLQLRQRLCEEQHQHPTGTVSHSFGAVVGDPTSLGTPGGRYPPSTSRGKARKAPQDRPKPPNCYPHPHHPHALNTFLHCSCFPAPYQGRFYFPAHVSPPQKKKKKKSTWRGSNSRKRPRVSQGVPALPRGTQALLTLLLCHRPLGLLALSHGLAGVWGQVLLDFHQN